MKTFNFHIDEKVSVWNRHYYSIEAKNKKEAIEQMKKELETPDYDKRHSEILFDTEETMTPEDNGNQPTMELYFEKETQPIQTNLPDLK